jgi:hypothetical protein
LNFLLDQSIKPCFQFAMASRMGLSLRPYQDLELKIRKVRPRHVRLAESVAFDLAIEKEDPALAPANVRKKAIKFVRLMLRHNFRQKAVQFADFILDQE